MSGKLLDGLTVARLLFDERIGRVNVGSDETHYQEHYYRHCEKDSHQESSVLADELVLHQHPEDCIHGYDHAVADYLGCAGTSAECIQLLILLSFLLHYYYAIS